MNQKCNFFSPWLNFYFKTHSTSSRDGILISKWTKSIHNFFPITSSELYCCWGGGQSEINSCSVQSLVGGSILSSAISHSGRPLLSSLLSHLTSDHHPSSLMCLGPTWFPGTCFIPHPPWSSKAPQIQCCQSTICSNADHKRKQLHTVQEWMLTSPRVLYLEIAHNHVYSVTLPPCQCPL